MAQRTKRFEFEDDDYWEINAEKTWGAQRAVEPIIRSFLKMDGATVDAATGEVKGEIILDPERWDPNAANEVLLLHSTVAWSYGVIAPEIMARIPMSHVQQVLDYVNEVYPKQDPLASGTPGVERGNSSSLHSSDPTRRSRRRWWTRTFSMRRDGRPKSLTPNL